MNQNTQKHDRFRQQIDRKKTFDTYQKQLDVINRDYIRRVNELAAKFFESRKPVTKADLEVIVK